ncbi:Wzz/FepE/Etk N-terminal domain-containing protein [Micromonospora sp. DT81.3]|uniref:Wzz/FepE/Etk N-terminal domain-containing protein n=1 Tax=Micromonospora sp. DT81.3 TaxID=3416523 RepID=UPI003CEA3A0D
MSPTTLVRALRKWWWVVVGLTVLGGAAGAAATMLMTPQYESTSQIFVAFDAPAGADSSELVQANNFAIQKVYSYTEVAKSQRVLDEVINELNLDTTADELARDITVMVPVNSAVLQITAVAPNADDAAALSAAVVSSFSDVVLELETPTAGGVPPLRIESLEEPVPSEDPSSPNLLVNIALGMFVGFALGILWIAIAALRDRKIYNGSDLASESGSLRAIGSVPVGAKSDSPTVVLDDPLSAIAESYRTIAATLAHSTDADLSVVAVAAATPRDRSSALTSNLALTLKEFGARVAIIDANLRSGSISSSLGLDGPGLAQCLSGTATASDAITQVNGIGVLPAGTTTDSPAELIAGARFSSVVREVAASYDIVLIDSAPVLPLSDTLFAASAAKSVLLAVTSGSVTPTQLQAAKTTLEGVDASVLGVVVLDAARSGADADVSTAAYRDLRPARS